MITKFKKGSAEFTPYGIELPRHEWMPGSKFSTIVTLSGDRLKITGDWDEKGRHVQLTSYRTEDFGENIRPRVYKDLDILEGFELRHRLMEGYPDGSRPSPKEVVNLVLNEFREKNFKIENTFTVTSGACIVRPQKNKDDA